MRMTLRNKFPRPQRSGWAVIKDYFGPATFLKGKKIPPRRINKANWEAHEVNAFEEFWQWKNSLNDPISDNEDDWIPYWECFWAGYKESQKGME